MLSLFKVLPNLAHLFLLNDLLGSEALRNELIMTSDCVCPGFSVTYECTVRGTENGFTVWQGSAFNCASNEIALRHQRYSSEEGALGECNGGSILGRSLRIAGGSFYTSQLSVRVSHEVMGKTVECILDDINSTSRLIGNAIVPVNITTGPFPPPGQVSINLTVLQTRQLIISWSPVAPDCPAVHYNILASNCGSCPTTTNHTNVTCTDVPISATLCVFALRTVACEHITGMSSNPISLSLSNGSSIHENIINSGDNDNNRKVLISGLIGALISAIVLFAVCVLPFMIAIIMLVRIKKRLRNQLASSKATVKYNTTSESDSKSAESDTKLDTRKNISYETNPAAVRAKKNIAYEDKPIAVDTRKNVAYEVNVVSSSFLKD